MSVLSTAVGIGLTLTVAWAVFVAVLVAVKPRGIDLQEAKRLVPDLVRLLRALARDRTVPRSVRTRLGLLLAYLVLPVDLVPDFVPVLGYADDVIIVALALRSVVRLAGPSAIDRHWTGSHAGLSLVHSLAGIRADGAPPPPCQRVPRRVDDEP